MKKSLVLFLSATAAIIAFSLSRANATQELAVSVNSDAGEVASSVVKPVTISQSALKEVGLDSKSELLLVMVDKVKLTPNQISDFEKFLETANLPATKIGKACKYNGKPDVWCLVLDNSVAQEVSRKLDGQSFSDAKSIKPVKRLRRPKNGG